MSPHVLMISAEHVLGNADFNANQEAFVRTCVRLSRTGAGERSLASLFGEERRRLSRTLVRGQQSACSQKRRITLSAWKGVAKLCVAHAGLVPTSVLLRMALSSRRS